MRPEDRRAFFDSVAEDWDRWRAKNRYYHAKIAEFVMGAVPPDADVLELGSGTGELLSRLQPRRGLGLNLSKRLTELAAQKHPQLEFATCGVDEIALPNGFAPQYVVL